MADLAKRRFRSKGKSRPKAGSCVTGRLHATVDGAACEGAE